MMHALHSYSLYGEHFNVASHSRLTGNDSFPSVRKMKAHMSQAFDLIHVSNSCLNVWPAADDLLQHFCLNDHDTICTK